jgi:hypothetical protein
VVAKIEWHAGELFPRVGVIVTNLNKHSKNVVKFCNEEELRAPDDPEAAKPVSAATVT